ncbi:MAG: rod shape-determining protein MreC [Helicobacteraceae bacterium]|nr:rod shape-determining protein MreC [Helicobacteraceae bacterium]
MTKGSFKLLVLLIALLSGALYFNKSLQTPFIIALNDVKIKYNSLLDHTYNTVEEHFRQKENIQKLRSKLLEYEEQHLISNQLSSELNDMFVLSQSKLNVSPKVELARIISYSTFGDHNKFWLDVNEYNSSKIYGLVYNEYTAGIVVPKNDQALALLNGDPKSSYAVYIGEKLAPGIVKGTHSKELYVEFIPAWINIKEGDEVITSGLDNIFFEGLKVGKVLSISKSQGYQNAVIKPYYTHIQNKYFHIIKEVK